MTLNYIESKGTFFLIIIFCNIKSSGKQIKTIYDKK